MATDTYWPRINGVTVAIDTFRRQLTRLGHTVYVFAPKYPASSRHNAVKDDERVYRFPSFGFFVSPEDRVGYPNTRWKMAEVLDELHPDIVHSHTEFTIGSGCNVYCRRNAMPHIMSCHTFWEEILISYFPFVPLPVSRLIVKKLSRHYSRYFDRLIVPSRFIEKLMRSYGARCPIDVIPNGITPGDFVLQEAEREALAAHFAQLIPGIGGRRFLLYAGRIAREKNLDLLLEAMKQIARKVPEVLLLLAGSGPYHARLENRVREKGLAGRIRFTGYLDRKQLSYAYSNAEAFLFTSKTDTQGLVLLEAMHCGTPVVAIRSSATEEVLGEGLGGFLVDDDVSQFVQRVVLLLRDAGMRSQKSEEARAVARNWTIEKMTERLLYAYEQVIKPYRTTRGFGAFKPGTGDFGC